MVAVGNETWKINRRAVGLEGWKACALTISGYYIVPCSQEFGISSVNTSIPHGI